MTTANGRTADHPIAPQFLERWSPRAFTGEAMSEKDLLTILEAARWAPSAYNAQPWRFVYALRGTPSWDKLLSLLLPFNQAWAKEAGALVFIVSATTLLPPGATERVPYRSHAFDTGAAWGFASLEAQRLGWHSHAMGGFDHERSPAELGLPADYRVEAAVAFGRLGDKSILPEKLQAREVPAPREPLSALAFDGAFKA
ncbi:MAG: nitroreductase family protein [Azospirillaceae bacterium]|nr:nitroreductase family protein [Azospirillaceae bacterium]